MLHMIWLWKLYYGGLEWHLKSSKLSLKTCKLLLWYLVVGFHGAAVMVLVVEGFFKILSNAGEGGIRNFVMLSSYLLMVLYNCACWAVEMFAVSYKVGVVYCSNHGFNVCWLGSLWTCASAGVFWFNSCGSCTCFRGNSAIYELGPKVCAGSLPL